MIDAETRFSLQAIPFLYTQLIQSTFSSLLHVVTQKLESRKKVELLIEVSKN